MRPEGPHGTTAQIGRMAPMTPKAPLPSSLVSYRWLDPTVPCVWVPMTNADIESMLTIITKTVNTLSEVASDIDELLDTHHTFTVNRSEWRIVEYR